MKIRSITAPNPGPFTLDGTRTYLLGDTTVIDPGPAIDSHVEAILEAMPRLGTILITHRHADHAPAAIPLKAMTGARVMAPRGLVEPVDRYVSGGEPLVVEGELLDVIATPGHTSEHVCYLTEAGDLFSGDTILGEGTTTIFPPDGSMGDYLRSLAILRRLSPGRIYPGHGRTRDDAMILIGEYIAHRLQRERQVIDALAAGATTLPEMRQRIYPDLDPRLEEAAEIQLGAHLTKLMEEGKVSPGNGAWRLVS